MTDTATPPPYAAAVLVAAGKSSRMGGDVPKPLLPLAGRTVLAHTVEAFRAAASVGPIVVVVAPQLQPLFEAELATFQDHIHAIVPGGAQRMHSSSAGLEAVPAGIEVTLVHDAARPLVQPAHIDAVAACARERGAALLAVPVRDTLHHSPDDQLAHRVVDRNGLWAAQTPQGFRTELLARLIRKALADGVVTTDEAALHELQIGPLPIVEGSPTNLKLTTPDDLRIAQALLDS